MDGPAIGGGGGGVEIASGYATITADLSGLRAAEEEARRIMDRIGQMGGSGQIGNPTNGATFGSGMMLSVRIDESALRQQIESVFRSFHANPIRLPVELDVRGGGGIGGGGFQMTPLGASAAAIANIPAAISPPPIEPYEIASGPYGVDRAVRTPGVSGNFVGGLHHSEIGRRWMNRLQEAEAEGGTVLDDRTQRRMSAERMEEEGRVFRRQIAADRGGDIGGGFNPFRVGGLSRALGLPLAAAWIGDIALRTAGGLLEAGNTEAHPEYLTQQFALASSGNTQQMLAPYAAQLANAQANQQRIGAVEGIPLFGALLGVGDSALGISSSLAARTATIQQSMQSRLAMSIEGDQATVGRLRLSGDDVGAAEEEARLTKIAFDKKYRAATRKTFGIGTPEMEEEGNAVFAAADDRVEAARRGRASFLIGVGGRMNQSEFMSQSYAALGTFSAGSEEAALEARQKAEMAGYVGTNNALIAGAKDSDRPALQKEFDLGVSTLTDKQAYEAKEVKRKNEDELTNIQAQGDAARLRSRGDTFSAEIALFNAHASNLRRSMAGKTSSEIDQVNQSISSEREALIFSQAQSIGNAFAAAGTGFSTSMLGVGAANMRIGGDIHGAAMQQFAATDLQLAKERRLAEQLPWYARIPQQIGLAGQGFLNDANRRTTEIDYQRDFAEQDFELDTRRMIAANTSDNMPMAARAVGAVGRARLEYDRLKRTTSNPQRLAYARTVLSEELEAERHGLIGQRGGAVAIDSSFANATAIPAGLDLTGEIQDRLAAAGALGRGIQDIRNGRAIAPNPINGAGAAGGGEEVGNIADLVKRYLPFLEKIANLKGVSLFSGN